jgi:hypothetical protein
MNWTRQNPSWDDDWHSSCQIILLRSWNRKIQYHAQRSQPLVPLLIQIQSRYIHYIWQCVLECDKVQSGRNLRMFRWNVVSSFSELKSEARKTRGSRITCSVYASAMNMNSMFLRNVGRLLPKNMVSRPRGLYSLYIRLFCDFWGYKKCRQKYSRGKNLNWVRDTNIWFVGILFKNVTVFLHRDQRRHVRIRYSVEKTKGLTEILEFLWLRYWNLLLCCRQSSQTETHLLVFSNAVITLQTCRMNAGRIKEQGLCEGTQA